jgi:hypothetical protein
MEPQSLKENFSSQLEKLEDEISKLRRALAQRQELAIKLQGAIEAMQIQLGEEPGTEDDVVEEAVTSPDEAVEDSVAE